MALEKVLVVDDDPNICDVLRMYLENEGYSVILAYDGEEALVKFNALKPDIILLDVMLPTLDGWQVCREVRKKSSVPIIMITAKGDTFDKVLGLELGADDYIVKPFDTKEVIARIKAIARRVGNSPEESEVKEVRYDKLSVNMTRYELRVDGKVVDTPPKELELLFYLASNPNRVYTRDQLLDEVWGFEYYGDSRTIDVHIKRLREKLEGVSDKWSLKTVWGVGYKLIRLLLVAVVLIITVTALSGYAISKYKQDYYSNSMRVCDIMAKDFTEYNAQNPQLDLWQEYIPKSVDKVSEQMQAFLYVFDADGSCRIASSNSSIAAADLTLNNEMLAGIRKGGEYLTDKASGKIDHSIVEPMLTRGFTFTLTENGVEATYYLFGASYTKPLNLYTTHLFLFMAILSFTLLLIAGVLIFYQVWRGNSQLEQLEAALQRYAQGNYSQPIPVEQYASSNLELIAALSEQIGSQSGRAEESSRQFVSNVSHELRTPMTIISGFVEGILDGTVPKNKRMEYLSIVSQEVQRLKMLVTSMLNLTKFDAGTIQLNYRMFILNDTAFRTILMFENRLEKRHISVEGLDGEPVRVCADPDLIGQVVYNLVENAVKFVNDGGTISFTFADEEDCWVFAVRNTGNGISKEELPKIFERFYKSDASRSQDKTGLGLGLDITKKIIHLHHAQISVRSEEHAYTEFEVRLPHVEPPEQEHE